MNFEPKKTYFGRVMRWNKALNLISLFSPIFLLFSALSGFLIIVYEEEKIIGFFIISFLLFLFLESLNHFRKEKLLIREKIEKTDNLAEYLNIELIKIFLKKDPKNIYALIFYLIKDCPRINFIFNRALISIDEIKDKLKKESHDLKKEEIISILESAKILAESKGKKNIEPEDIISIIFKVDDYFKKLLVLADLLDEDIDNLIFWLENLKKRRDTFFVKKGAMGRKWSSGFSPTLDTYGINITSKIRNYAELISHSDEIVLLERALIKSAKSNALIVGNPGSGRKSLVYNFAQRSLFGKSIDSLNYKRIIEVDMETLLSRIQNVEEVEFTLDSILKEAVLAGDIILVINNIHNFVEENPRIGTVNITGIISPFLNIPDFKFIAITDYSGLHAKIEKNPSLLSSFEKIEISEVSKSQTLRILETLVPYYEKRYKIFIPYISLKEIVDISERYLPNLFFPEKGIELLEEVSIYVSSNKGKIILSKDVDNVVSKKTDIPIGDVAEKEKEILLNMEDLIHERIINQEEAVREISTSLRRARAEIKTRKGPMGSFLFLGPTGVGKTETAKALADIYFGSEKKIIRLDMSEFQSGNDISRLIGIGEETGIITSVVRENPFSLILLDELEKAHPNVLNLFLQVLDEGHITDGMGQKIDFKNSIIIATSNAGYQIILDAIENKEEWGKVKEEILNYIFKESIFKPEFINRFDAVVLFHALTKDNLIKISSLILNSLQKNLEKKGINFNISNEIKEKIVELSYNPKFGAREMRRVIQDKIENKIAEAFLNGKIEKGNTIEIVSDNFEILIK